jgi:hypothetical protein
LTLASGGHHNPPGIGVDIVASTSEELAAFNRSELAKWSKIVRTRAPSWTSREHSGGAVA